MKKLLLVSALGAMFASSLMANGYAGYKDSFMDGCTVQGTKKENGNLCSCVWNKIEKKYTINEIKTINEMEGTQDDLSQSDFGKNVIQFSNDCFKEETSKKTAKAK